MKWKLPRVGDKRVVSLFLWKPLEIAGEKRWLEKVKIEQVFVKEIHDNSGLLTDDKETRHQPHHFDISGEFKWVNIKFIDGESKKNVEVVDEMEDSKKRR